MRKFFRNYTLYIAWVLTLFGILLSFFLTEILNFEACNLCWFQRICLYPLGLILGIACYRGFHGISFYLLPQVVLGLILACYQIAIQEIPGFNPIDICGRGPNCVTKHEIGLGPISIPMLSAMGFFLIGLFLSISFAFSKKGEY